MSTPLARAPVRPQPTSPVELPRGRAVGLFVWAAWAVMLAAVLVFVARFSSNVPSWDDWDMVPTLTGRQPVTLEWLWSQHNEHRVPFPRLLLLALSYIAGVDFRTPMFFNVLAMGAVAAAMIGLAGRLRGHVSLSDAFFPLVVLHWGQAANWLWGWQIQFFASAILAIVVLLMIVRAGTVYRLTGHVIAAGVSVVLLTMSGANGLGMVPALALWLLYLAWDWRRLPERRNQFSSLVVGALGVVALLLTALYFVEYESVPWHPKSAGPLETLYTSAQFITVGLGPAVRHLWPVSGLLAFGAALAIALLLAHIWRTDPEERHRAAGLLLFLGAMSSLALGLGLGRNGFETRYVTLALPFWCCVYFAVSLYAPPRFNQRGRILLLIAALLALAPNTWFGVAYARELQGELRSFEHDLAAGHAPYRLIARYAPYLHPHHDLVSDYLGLLKEAGSGQYRLLQNNPRFAEIPVLLNPVEVRGARWEGTTAYVTGEDAHIDFVLPEDRHVAGVRLEYRHRNADGVLPFVGVLWKSSQQSEFPRAQMQKYSPTGDRANWERGAWTRIGDSATTMTIWIDDTVNALRILPDLRPGTFELSELVLLVPEEDMAHPTEGR
jgi:hypothetical protein